MIQKLLIAQDSGGFWVPPSASSYSDEVDWLFYVILWICAIMLALVTVLVVTFAIRYRARRGHRPARLPSHSTALELTWTVIPTIVVLAIFYFGFRGFMNMVTVPPNAYDIQVTAYKWGWSFAYPNGHTDNTLHVPLGQPIRLTLRSEDVIHSLYVPAFRIKKDLVPGRYNTTWFQPEMLGEFRLYCAEYCGTKHSAMATTVRVLEPGAFRRWLADAANLTDRLPPVEAGRQLYGSKGCNQCHSVDGKAGIGPTFKDRYGKERLLGDGSSVKVDDNYIRESILEPRAKVAAGYEPNMPTYRGRIRDAEITALIAYIKSLAESGSSDPTPDESPR